MSQAHFIVFDLTTGAIKRHGNCPAQHLQAQARADKNEGVREDVPRSQMEARDLMIEQRVVMPAKGSPYLRSRPAADIEERRARLTAPVRAPGINELLAVLKDKHGLTVTPADMAAAMAKTATKDT